MNRALRVILRQLGASLFTTACYIIVDLANAQLIFANAGHPSPLRVCGTSRVVEPITVCRSVARPDQDNHASGVAGPALGLFEDVVYHTHHCPVGAGDSLLVFTDGLYEVENAKAETFGLGRLSDAIRQRADLPLAQLMQEVFSEVEGFAQGHAFADDVCLVGMEIARLEPGAAAAPVA